MDTATAAKFELRDGAILRFGAAWIQGEAAYYFGKCRNCTAHNTHTGVGSNSISRDGSQLVNPFSVECSECGGEVRWNQVRATFKAETKCGAKCLHAKRADCECSCNGKNHGIAA